MGLYNVYRVILLLWYLFVFFVAVAFWVPVCRMSGEARARTGQA